MSPKIVLPIFLVVTLLVIMALVVKVRTSGSDLSPFTGTGLPLISKSGSGKLDVLAESRPEFKNIAAWINSEPLTNESLKGKVVLIDFWTYSCINCIRTLPYVTAWYEKYKDNGFTVIGVHTPEFAFEKVEKNVREATVRHSITYPVALDNDYGTWNAYNNHYWPAHYLYDAKGRLRSVHFGEGKYEETEQAIRELIAEAGEPANDDVSEIKSDGNLFNARSPETYVGYSRQESFESPEKVVRDEVREYSIPAKPSLNKFSLAGKWMIESERAVLKSSEGEIVYRYDASTANLVMGADGESVRAEITLDGAPVPLDLRGSDVVEVSGRTYVDVACERLYSLTDSKGRGGQHVLKLRFLKAGAACYAFTFG